MVFICYKYHTREYMLNNRRVEYLSTIYGIPIEDIIMIALNRYGVMANISDNRVRFKIKINKSESIYYCAVCVNTYPSPFSIDENGILYLSGEQIGYIFERERDTCDSTYFRRNKTELTINSNKRSQCKGCKFCGTYSLEPSDMSDLNNAIKMSEYLESLLEINKINDFSNLIRVTVCTGCFEDENALVEHLIMIKDVFSNFGFNKRIRYIGSQLRSTSTMETVAKYIKFFSLTFTAECFSRRKEFMRKEKAEVEFSEIQDILQKSLNYGFSTNYLYILGLDSLEVMQLGMERLKKSVNRFPGIQIMQNYNKDQENQRIIEAKDIEYYLKARKIVEAVYGNEEYKPRLWENYRGLFYTMFNSQKIEGIHI